MIIWNFSTLLTFIASCIWNFSEYFNIPLGDFAPKIFEIMINKRNRKYDN